MDYVDNYIVHPGLAPGSIIFHPELVSAYQSRAGIQIYHSCVIVIPAFLAVIPAQAGIQALTPDSKDPMIFIP